VFSPFSYLTSLTGESKKSLAKTGDQGRDQVVDQRFAIDERETPMLDQERSQAVDLQSQLCSERFQIPSFAFQEFQAKHSKNSKRSIPRFHGTANKAVLSCGNAKLGIWNRPHAAGIFEFLTSGISSGSDSRESRPARRWSGSTSACRR